MENIINSDSTFNGQAEQKLYNSTLEIYFLDIKIVILRQDTHTCTSKMI